MEYVITSVGARRKTTLVHKLENDYVKKNSVAILTTTHMFLDNYYEKIEDIPVHKIEKNKIYCFGKRTEEGRIEYVGDEQYNKICEKMAIVIVEGDGSRMLPSKIPRKHEPVIPTNTNEIYVVYGNAAIVDKLGIVCHGFDAVKEKVKEL